MDFVLLALAATATALATDLGAVPVFFMGTRAEALRPILLGTTIGAMVAAVVGRRCGRNAGPGRSGRRLAAFPSQRCGITAGARRADTDGTERQATKTEPDEKKRERSRHHA